jgi:hypothetical protein
VHRFHAVCKHAGMTRARLRRVASVVVGGVVLVAMFASCTRPRPPATTTTTSSSTTTTTTTTTCADGKLDDVQIPGAELHIYVIDSWCEQPFGIVDIDFGADACVEPQDCAGQRTARLFRQAVGDRWVDIYQHPHGGCGEILALRPDFPVALCRDLPALKGGTYWGG